MKSPAEKKPELDGNVIPASRRSGLDDQKTRPTHPKRRLLIYASTAAAILYLVTLHLIPTFLTLPENLTHTQIPGIEITDRDGRPLRHFLADNDLRLDRPAVLDEIPRTLIDATLAAEDTRFYTHNGIDYTGVARAARDAVIHREFVSGASTVSQQLIKISSTPRDRNLTTKVIEALSARRLEQLWRKDDILVAYLNRLPYGNQLTGCRAAARGYFSKPLADLSLAESAFLAGLPNKPTKLNPHRNFNGAVQRQHYILRRMLEEDLISSADYRNALDEPIQLIARARSPFLAPHLVDLVIDDLPPEIFAPERRIRTSLDSGLQQFAEQSLSDQLGLLDQKLGGAQVTQGAVVVIDNASGEVLALAGSRDFSNSPGGQINGAWTPRSPGSALKPFTYLLALERGHTAASVLPDLAVEYPTPTGAYRPVNFDRQFHGPVSLRHALANSLNVPAVRLLDDLGGPAVLHETLETLGLTSIDAEPSSYGLGLTLGTAEVRLLELTNAYATLARLGNYTPYKLSLSSNDPELDESVIPASRRSELDDKSVDDPKNPKSRIQDRPPTLTRLFSADAAYILADILSDNRARSAAFGLHSPLRFDNGLRVAAKTGTSTDFRDNWCLGFTPDYTVGVWVGRFDNQPLQGISGVSGAGPIFHDLMVRAHRDQTPRWYDKPATLVEASIDPLNGKRIPIASRQERDDTGIPTLRAGQAPTPHQTHTEIFRSTSHLPPFATISDYEAATHKTLLPQCYARWLDSDGSALKVNAAITTTPSTSADTVAFQILSPAPGTTAYLDPDLPDHGRYFPLEISGTNQQVEWRSDTLSIDISNATTPLAVLTPGRHRITATDPNSGAKHSIDFVVEGL